MYSNQTLKGRDRFKQELVNSMQQRISTKARKMFYCKMPLYTGKFHMYDDHTDSSKKMFIAITEV